MDCLASLYIDNELDLDAKVRFIDRIHSQPVFYADARALLLQEKLLRLPTASTRLPSHPPLPSRACRWWEAMVRPLMYAAAGFAAAGLLLFSVVWTSHAPETTVSRFVIYEPDARQVELTGTFTDWQRTPMHPAGRSGYWELSLPVPVGEHRFAYILDGHRQMADPTLFRREKDDYGGENSILEVEAEV